MKAFTKAPYNLQCGDHIAVQIKSHNGQWSEPSKPNTPEQVGTTVKVKPEGNGPELKIGDKTTKKVLELTWKD